MLDKDISDLRMRYVYTRDKTDRWTLLDNPDGPLCGDCEDWAYTVLWLIAGKSWLRFWTMILTRKADLWWTKFHGTGQPHVMLWVKGYGWTDSYYPTWGVVHKHPPLKRYGVVKLALTLLVK